MAADRTDSIAPDARSRPRESFALIVALDCQSLAAWPERHVLDGIGEIVVARGPRRAFVVEGPRARLELADRWISQQHARIRRGGGGWSVEDLGSRNGTRLNGERVTQASFSDGDVLECGGTFLILRQASVPIRDLEPLAELPEAMRTVSPALGHELDVMRKVARSPLPILVLGDTGTGKEGMVNLIHAMSGRPGPLVAVNCGAIPATLIESELFGSKKGAFSGAEDRPGLVRAADRGTLFLDELAELPLPSQAALLRVLQEKEVLALGSTRALPVDVRVIAATNAVVTELVEEGKLRRDLYGRLRGYELRLPPLRERLEDLGLLIAALLRRHDPDGAPRTLSRAAAWMLFAHDWPLNIRELEQCVAAAVALTAGEIGVEHLPRAVRDSAAERRAVSTDDRQQLLALIARHGGNLSAVARELATSRSQLYRLLSRHAIRPDELKRPPDDGSSS